MVIKDFKKLTDRIIKKTGNRSKVFKKKLEDNFKRNLFNGKKLMRYSVTKNKRGDWDLNFDWK